MTIQNLVTLAQSGVLKNISVGDDIDSVIGFMNLGLIELYKRFPLHIEEAIVNLQDGKTIYKLDGTDADVSLPADAGFMWITEAYQEVLDNDTNTTTVESVPINEEDNPLSINTISFSQVQIPITTTGGIISIIYVAAPKYYTSGDVAETVPVPPQMIDALLLYIGYQGQMSVNAEFNAENSTHFTRFEKSCNDILTRGMYTSDDVNTNKKFTNNGWA